MFDRWNEDLEDLKLTKKKKDSTIEVSKLVEEEVTVAKKNLKEPKVIRFFSLGNEESKPGVYSMEFDVNNNQLVSLSFEPETSPGEARERFKIKVAPLFRLV